MAQEAESSSGTAEACWCGGQRAIAQACAGAAAQTAHATLTEWCKRRDQACRPTSRIRRTNEGCRRDAATAPAPATASRFCPRGCRHRRRNSRPATRVRRLCSPTYVSAATARTGNDTPPSSAKAHSCCTGAVKARSGHCGGRDRRLRKKWR